MEGRWGARDEGVLKRKAAQPQPWREPYHHDEWREQQQWQPLREVSGRMADGAAHMGMGGRAEELGRMHPRVDRLNEQEDEGYEADKRAKQNTWPTRKHRPQELLATYPV
jgi:hypothetical protein